MQQKDKPRRRLADENKAAELLDVRPQALRNARCTGKGELATIPHFKVGRLVKYDLDWIDRVWLERRRRGITAP
jgi:hypothetical protein